MIYRLDNIKLGIYGNDEELQKIAVRKLGSRPSYFRILKKSLDARKKSDIHYICSIEFSDGEENKQPSLEKYTGAKRKIIVVGSGPAGLFCALRLVDRGFAPIVVERGECVEDRASKTEYFFNGGKLDPESNVQFGEGGAGTFSDGKLNTQTHGGYNAEVLAQFARFGAPEEILFLNKPHIGSDILKKVVRNMREYIIARGGEIRFSTRLDGLVVMDGELREVIMTDFKSAKKYTEKADCLVLAVGHSARDTFVSLRQAGLSMESREFAIGVRIEHLQCEIGRAQYGEAYKKLPAADYKLVSHAGERTAFTFCMCPGGYVMPASSEEGGVVTNGMSNYARNGVNANSALLVQLNRADFGSCGNDLFAGMEFQRALERAAFAIGGSDYKAPVQLYKDFANDRVSARFGDVLPTYARGTVFAQLSDILPGSVIRTIKAAVPDMGRRLKGFDSPYAVMTGVETRFSSPVRILRGKNGESLSVAGVYPCGEGSGYSGGITSSAADGLRTADAIFNKASYK